MTAVQEALRFVTEPESQLMERRKALLAAHGRMLGVEHKARLDVTDELKQIELALATGKATDGLPILDKAVLAWRHPRVGGVLIPQLAVVHIDDPVVEFRATTEFGQRYAWKSTHLFNLDYRDVTDSLSSTRRLRWRNVTLSWEFTGVIPAATREKIEGVRREFHNRVYLLADAPAETWRLSTRRVSLSDRLVDPIVVGIDTKSRMRVVDVFDPTSLEDYIAKEFSA